nr:hypothetical protein [Tanacetum cinerariifolium]
MRLLLLDGGMLCYYIHHPYLDYHNHPLHLLHPLGLGERGASAFLIISSDSNHEAVVIPAMLHVASEAKLVLVASPVDVLDLVIHKDTESDPSEDPPSFDHAPVTLGISLFLSDDDYESDSESDPFEDSSQESSPLSPEVSSLSSSGSSHSLSSSETSYESYSNFDSPFSSSDISSHSSYDIPEIRVLGV